MDRVINCNVLTPDGPVYEGGVELAIVPAWDGEMGFLYNHAALIAELGIGEIRLRYGQETDYLVLEGGFVEIKDNEMVVFAEKAIKKENLVKEDIESAIKEHHAMEKPKIYAERLKLDVELKKLKARLKVASR